MEKYLSSQLMEALDDSSNSDIQLTDDGILTVDKQLIACLKLLYQKRSTTAPITKKEESVELLATGLLQIFQPSLLQVKKDLKELISKQNKTYVDISAEKFHYVDTNVSATEDLMVQIKIYNEKLIAIKKQMTTLHHRTKSLKARALHIQTCKEKELATRIQRRQQEEALIGNQFPTSSNMTT